MGWRRVSRQFKTILLGGAGPRGPSRVAMGFHGRSFHAVFRLENYFFRFFRHVFAMIKKLRRLAQTSSSNLTYNFRESEGGNPTSKLELSLVSFQCETRGRGSLQRQDLTRYSSFSHLLRPSVPLFFPPSPEVRGGDRPSQYFFRAKTCLKPRKRVVFRAGNRLEGTPVETRGDP